VLTWFAMRSDFLGCLHKSFTRGGAMVAEIITGPKRGNTVLIPRVRLYGDNTVWPFQWHRTQERP